MADGEEVSPDASEKGVSVQDSEASKGQGGGSPGRPEVVLSRIQVPKRLRWGLRGLMLAIMALSFIGLIDFMELFNSAFDLETELRALFIEDPQQGEEVLRDGVRFLSAFTTIMAFLLLAATFLVPLRYLLLMRKVRWGIPAVYRALMVWTVVLLVIQFGRLFIGLSLIAEDWEVIHPRLTLGWETIPAIALLSVLMRERTRQVFQVPRYTIHAQAGL